MMFPCSPLLVSNWSCACLKFAQVLPIALSNAFADPYRGELPSLTCPHLHMLFFTPRSKFSFSTQGPGLETPDFHFRNKCCDILQIERKVSKHLKARSYKCTPREGTEGQRKSFTFIEKEWAENISNLPLPPFFFFF